MAVRLAHVCIETAKLEETEDFYALLGIHRQFEFRNTQEQLVGMYLSLGDSTFIELIKVTSARVEGAIKHFAIEVEDIDQVRDTLLANHIEVSEKELAGDNTQLVTCHDPNGIFVELQRYTANSMQLIGGVCEVDYQPN